MKTQHNSTQSMSVHVCEVRTGFGFEALTTILMAENHLFSQSLAGTHPGQLNFSVFGTYHLQITSAAHWILAAPQLGEQTCHTVQFFCIIQNLSSVITQSFRSRHRFCKTKQKHFRWLLVYCLFQHYLLWHTQGFSKCPPRNMKLKNHNYTIVKSWRVTQ